MLLKQVGADNGDKGFQGNIPNMKQGEYRYYPQDNPNLKFADEKYITREDFIVLLNKYFPKYIVRPDNIPSDADKDYWIGSIGIMQESDGNKYYEPIVINKGYICFKEATKNHSGTVYYIHDGVVLIYKEDYKDLSCN